MKHEEVYLRAYDNVGKAQTSLALYFTFYNTKRPRSRLDVRTTEYFCDARLPQTAAAEFRPRLPLASLRYGLSPPRETTATAQNEPNRQGYT
jgi:hypothetical protein